MKRIATLALAATATLTVLAPVAAHAETLGGGHGRTSQASTDRGSNGRPSSYQLTGDEGGSKFEGIGADQRRGTFFVSEVTGGEIHRGTVGNAHTRQWIAGDGTDGRWTARGIKVDAAGNVYVAGGPNAIDHPGAPNVWIYSPAGELLASFDAPGDNVFLNDVIIGPDGAAYFTDSNTPRIFRVAQGNHGWGISEWANAAGTIPQAAGFNLGGIVLSADRTALVVGQGNTGDLWRFSLKSGAVSKVNTGGAKFVNNDGLVRIGNQLTVVQNFSKQISTLKLSANGSTASVVSRRATTYPDRVLTTAAELRGRILYVDSKFDEPSAQAPYEVIAQPFAAPVGR